MKGINNWAVPRNVGRYLGPLLQWAREELGQISKEIDSTQDFTSKRLNRLYVPREVERRGLWKCINIITREIHLKKNKERLVTAAK